MSQIRLNKTPELEEVLGFLRSKYHFLSEAEIIKVALVEKYKKEVDDLRIVDKETEVMIAKGLRDYKKGKYKLMGTDEDIEKHLNSL